MKLLIIEDEEIIQTILTKGFKKLGYLTDSSFDGAEAIDKFFEKNYDLIVLDLNLPKLNGIEVLKIIREETKEIPIIILSARSAIEDKIDGLDSDANDYLTKPFHFWIWKGIFIRTKYEYLPRMANVRDFLCC